MGLALLACTILPVGWAIKLAVVTYLVFPDFFGLWSFGGYVLSHPPASIYDDQALAAFQATFGMTAEIGHFPFPYPPWILLLLAPFGALPYGVARIGWLALTFGAYALALTPWRWPRLCAGLLLLAPSTAVGALTGQNGFLSAALMLGGLRLLPMRPLAAGALLAALAYKPQLALLVPPLLLFGRHWRALFGAALALSLLSLAVTLAFGGAIWGAWLEVLRVQVGAPMAGRQALLEMMPTLTAAAMLLGGGAMAIRLAQLVALAAGLLAVWLVRRGDDVTAAAVLPVATILATPYAFHYDLAMVTGAVLAVLAARLTAAEPFGPIEFPVLLASVLVPSILPAQLGKLMVCVPLLLVATLWLLVVRARRMAVG